jgi:uncharacterized membrane protein
MFWEIVATLCSGLFAGAAIYINLAEHPARMECGTAAAVTEFRPSYRRAAVLQASLAAVGSLAAVLGWWQGNGATLLVAGLLFGAVVPFTVIVILPTNKPLLDPSLDAGSQEASVLLRRWGRLHMVRSVLSGIAFILLVIHMAAGI